MGALGLKSLKVRVDSCPTAGRVDGTKGHMADDAWDLKLLGLGASTS